MIQLLKSDFYKLKRQKSFYVCLLVVVLYMAYIPIDFQSSVDRLEQISPSTIEWVYLMFKEQSFLPYVMTIVQSIFITLSVTYEYDSGTIKDPIALGFNRIKIYLSKLIVLSAATWIIMLAGVLTTIFSVSIVFGIYGSFGFIDGIWMLRMLLLQGLLFCGYTSIYLVLAMLIKKSGVSMAFNLIFSFILVSLPSIIRSFSWSRLFLPMNFEPIAMPQPILSDIYLVAGIAVLYLLITNIFGVFIFIKQEIK